MRPDSHLQVEIAFLLLSAGLLEAWVVVEDGVTIADLSRRNSNFLVSSKGVPTYFVKCGRGTHGLGTVSHEAWSYEWLADQVPALEDHLSRPRRHAWLEDQGILVLEAVDPAVSLGTMIRAGKVLSRRRASALGRAVAVLHRQRPQSGACLPSAIPPSWMLSVHRPSLEAARHLSAANLALARRIQLFEPLVAELDALMRDWEPSSIIHGDINWENILIRRRTGGRNRDIPMLVDWEFLAMGDPAWDLGCVFAEYLFHWAQTGPDKAFSSDDVDAALSFELERHIVEVVSFWEGYRTLKLLNGPEAAWLLSKTLRFAGGRLVHKTFEQLQQSAADESGHLRILQLATHLMERPLEAAVHLLGLRIAP